MTGEEKEEMIRKLYNLYSDAIYRYILLMIGNTEQAEDLTQETFLRAFKGLDSFEGNATSKTWLYTIARNITLDYLRRKRIITWIPTILHTNIPDQQPQPEDIVELGESTKHLHRALNKLKPSYKEIIVLRKIKGFSISETMDILNWSEGKVKSTLFRALQAIKQELVKEGYEHEAL